MSERKHIVPFKIQIDDSFERETHARFATEHEALDYMLREFPKIAVVEFGNCRIRWFLLRCDLNDSKTDYEWREMDSGVMDFREYYRIDQDQE